MEKPHKVIRIITAPEVVKFHLKNFLKYAPEKFEVLVIGTDVSSYQQEYPHIRWIDHEIPRKISVIKDFKALVGLIRILKKEKPDIIHSIMPKSGLLTALAGFLMRVPIRLHTFTGQVWATKKDPMRGILKFMDHLIIRLNTFCLTDSRSQSQFLYDNGLGFQGEPLPVLGKGSLDGIDLDVFDVASLNTRAQNLRQKYKIPEGAFIFLFLGRKNRDKGVHLLIKAFAKLSQKYADCYLLYVGPSEPDDALLVSPQEASIQNLIVVGKTQEPEVYIAASQVFCLPSYREGFGNTVIECASLGVPTVGSRIPGLVDSIQENITGILFPAGSEMGLYQSMEKLYLDSLLLNKLSQNCIKMVKEHYEAKKMQKLIFDLYQRLLIRL